MRPINSKMKTTCCVLLLLLGLFDWAQPLPWIAAPRADSHFTERHLSLLKVTKAHTGDEQIIFVGASSIENWMYNGLEVWGNFYMPRHAYNYGVSGDRVENVLWRIENGEFDNIKAKVVVLLVGSNNRQDKPADIVKGLEAVIAATQKKIANVKILLCSILPRGEDNNQVHETNKLLEAAEGKNEKQSVYYLDLTAPYESTPGFINTTLFVEDKLHLTKRGYQIWYDKMEPLLSKILA